MRLAIAIACLCLAPVAQAQEIRLADIVELSGAGAAVGANWRHGVDLAVEEINSRGGVLGHMLAVEHFDTQTQPGIARAQMLKALDEQPYAILGPIFSGSVKACMELSRDARIVQFVGGAASDLTQQGDEYLFRAGENQRVSGSVLATYVQKTLRAMTVSLVWINNDFGRDGRNILKEEFERRGLHIVEDISTEPGQLPFDAEVVRLSAARADAVAVVLNEEESARFLRSARKAGLRGTIVGGASLLSPEVIELAGPSSDGVKGLLGLTPYGPVKELQEFGRKFKARFHGVADHNAMEGSIAVYAVKVATERMGGLVRAGLAATLHGLTITPAEEPGILLTTRWDDKGDVERDKFLGEIIDGRPRVIQVIRVTKP